jgi:hypothetical protein
VDNFGNVTGVNGDEGPHGRPSPHSLPTLTLVVEPVVEYVKENNDNDNEGEEDGEEEEEEEIPQPRRLYRRNKSVFTLGMF